MTPQSQDSAPALATLTACPVCLRVLEGEPKALFWFVHEQYAEPVVLRRLDAALGFCARHTARLVQAAAPPVVASVSSFLLHGLDGRLQQLRRRLAGRRFRPAALGRALQRGPCPLCQQEEHEVRWAAQPWYWTGGRAPAGDGGPEHLCGTHLAMATRHLPPPHRPRLVARWVQQVAGTSDRDPLRSLARLVSVAAGSAVLAEQAPAGPADPQEGSSLQCLSLWLRRPGCLLCRVDEQAWQGYLGYLARELGAFRQDLWADVEWLCPLHLWGLALALPQRARLAVAEHLRRHRLGWMQRRPPKARWGRGGPEEGSWPVRPCPACGRACGAVQRWARLLAVALDHPTVALAYQEGQGVCVQHLAVLMHHTAAPEQAATVLDTMAVQARVLAWELEEFLRKRAWDARHEPPGPEATAPARAVRHYSGLAAWPGPSQQAGVGAGPLQAAGGGLPSAMLPEAGP